ncbi:arylamine N-acetyltransferase family protein [Macrococcus lamae]|uniref:Arylamine N-acetyltransferase n=1 Tax=Macrococcus lamae TaxID=198484 RepID=A0A4V3BEP9_9STAP|nr:arylamine N-acetyltransferase [Macrococcus lamae]TDM05234.1 arylamine N-acetyltransferase [Macrococcus lamae]
MDINRIDQFLEVPAEAALEDYMRAFMLKVPFENIDVQNRISISTETSDLFDKIVNQRRGGFCYELNTFFKDYLVAKGFHAYNVAATVKSPNGWAPKHSHMTTFVKTAQLYIVDVGFGDLPLKPVPLSTIDAPAVVHDVTGDFRAIRSGEQFELQKKINGKFEVLYKGVVAARTVEDFAQMIDYNQHDLSSIFVSNLLITKAQPDGRATMSHDYLTVTENGSKQKIKLTAANYREYMKQYFGLDVRIERLEDNES